MATKIVVKCVKEVDPRLDFRDITIGKTYEVLGNLNAYAYELKGDNGYELYYPVESFEVVK